MREYLLAALDDWALTETDAGARKRLLALTAEATGQQWRTRLAEVWTDGERLAKAYDAIPPGERSAGLIAGVGVRLQQLGQEGIRRLEEGLRRFPSDFWLHALLGLGGGKERPERRIGAYRAALAVRPGAAAIHNNLGVLLYDGGDLAGAEACFREAIRLDPKFAKAFYNLGNARRDLAGAEAFYRKAIRLDPKFAKAFYNLGRLLGEGGDRAGAEACYREAIRLDPKFAKAFVTLGNILQAGGDRAGAEACYREAIRLDPKFAEAFNNLGGLLYDGGDLAGAEACFREAIRLDPKFAKAFVTLGNILKAGGDRAGAEACYREAIRLDPKLAMAFYNLGVLLLDGGDLAGAGACYREAIRLDPKYAQAHANLGWITMNEGRIREAVELLDKAHSLAPKDQQIKAMRIRAKRRLALSERLPAIERGSDAPASPTEAIELAQIAAQEFQKRYALAYRLLLAEFAADAASIAPNRYNAACVAVRFAAGDDPKDKPCEKQRASLRKQTAEWLAVNLASARRLAASEKAADRQRAAGVLGHWLQDSDLASVRDSKRLATLSPEERQRWEAFWADVRATLAKATAKGADPR